MSAEPRAIPPTAAIDPCTVATRRFEPADLIPSAPGTTRAASPVIMWPPSNAAAGLRIFWTIFLNNPTLGRYPRSKCRQSFATSRQRV